ncbi:MAG: type II secretion system F family protein [Candidatus Desulfofervidaceae bacterium]|nr:type II secretion system F family protein [Candidatus Desulfofervidaceae bacterium]MDL1970494.1 type II secretion system F family protein [Candidatus Desulfofervidaceae bacterium]
MSKFHYKAYRQDGVEVNGILEAEDAKEAVIRLKEQGLFPKNVKKVTPHKWYKWNRTDISLLPQITAQLSTLLSAGVPLMEALNSLKKENKGKWQEVLANIETKVAEGSSLAKALEIYPEIFPEFYINMVAAGESSGTLDQILAKLADFLEEKENLKTRVKMAMIYPSFTICVSFIVLFLLFSLVVPKIVKIFADTKAALPLVTVVLIKISHFFQTYGWFVFVALFVFAYSLRKVKKAKAIWLDKLWLKIPGDVIQSLYWARLTRIFGLLLEGGVPVLKALELTSKSLGNKYLENKVLEATQKVAEGSKISLALTDFPPVLLQLIATGEKSGHLVDILKKAADSYEEAFSKKIQKTLTLLEPTIILVMGMIVGFIVMAILLPIFQLNQLIK